MEAGRKQELEGGVERHRTESSGSLILRKPSSGTLRKSRTRKPRPGRSRRRKPEPEGEVGCRGPGRRFCAGRGGESWSGKGWSTMVREGGLVQSRWPRRRGVPRSGSLWESHPQGPSTLEPPEVATSGNLDLGKPWFRKL